MTAPIHASPAGALAAASEVMLGVYQHGAPWNMGALAHFEALVERPVAIVMWYQDWAITRALDCDLLRAVADHGAVPLITWEPWDHSRGAAQPAFHLERLLAGTHDAHLRSWASALASYERPVLLRWAREMNGNWYPWGIGNAGTTAAHYRSAWRHVWSIFQAEGANNVRWVWSPNVLHGAAAFEPCFPGDEYVDWLGLDGYNWGGWLRWRSFTQVFEAAYRRITALSPKPLMIAEMACAEDGRRKARWISDAFEVQIPVHFPRVRAVIWFNQDKERDWRVESSPESRRAFAAAVAPPRYRGSWQ